MSRVKIGLVVSVLAGLAVVACSSGPDFLAEDEPWRRQVELACLNSNVVPQTPYIEMRSRLGGPSYCGAERPFKVAAASFGAVSLKPAAILRCPMVPVLDQWVGDVVQPAAQRNFRQPVVEVKVISSYSCRPMNNVRGARLSEHGYANALDVSQFTLADGRQVSVLKGWGGRPDDRAFLRQVHRGACGIFSTVLGPNYDRKHHDHFHVDLARRRGQRKVCH